MHSEVGKPPVVSMLEMAMGMWISQSLATAAKLGIADLLKGGPRPIVDLAKSTKSDEASLYRLMRMLASRGVFTESPARSFALTPLGDLLREDAPGTIKHAAIMFNRPHNTRSWEECEYSIRTGKPALDKVFGIDTWKYFASHPEEQANFDRAMTNLASTMHAAAVEAYDFGSAGITSLVDVGGGHGRLLAVILKKHPALKGVVFDQPHVVAGASKVFDEMGVSARARGEGGNFFESVPAGHDAYLMSHILHDWPDDKCLTILKNCRKAIKPGGKLLVLDAVIKPGNEPDLGKIIDMEMLVCVSGRERTEQEIAGLFTAAGFAFKRAIPTKSSVTIVEGVAG